MEMEHLKREKEELLNEVASTEVLYANSLARERAKLQQINEQEVKNLTDLNEVFIEELRNEINHLRNLLDCKST